MGASKSQLFTAEQNQISAYAKAFAHPARVAILQAIMNQNTCVCGDLVTEIGLAQSTISQHLKELKTIGLIQGDIDGTSVCYCINDENWSKMQTQLSLFMEKKTTTNNCC